MITATIKRSEILAIAEKAKSYNRIAKADIAKDLAESAYKLDANIKSRLQRRTTDFGGIVSQIKVEKYSRGLTWEVTSGANYSAYVEFGTGKNVDLKDLVRAGFPESFAMQFKGKGIKEVNLEPQNFFYGAVANEMPKLLEKLKETLEKNGKKF